MVKQSQLSCGSWTVAGLSMLARLVVGWLADGCFDVPASSSWSSSRERGRVWPIIDSDRLERSSLEPTYAAAASAASSLQRRTDDCSSGPPLPRVDWLLATLVSPIHPPTAAAGAAAAVKSSFAAHICRRHVVLAGLSGVLTTAFSDQPLLTCTYTADRLLC